MLPGTGGTSDTHHTPDCSERVQWIHHQGAVRFERSNLRFPSESVVVPKLEGLPTIFLVKARHDFRNREMNTSTRDVVLFRNDFDRIAF